jgi:hypothetical protein
MIRHYLSLIIVAAAVTAAPAHFIWIVPDDQGNARVIFSDSLKPDRPELLAKIAKTSVFVRSADGKETPLKWTDGKDAFILSPGKGPKLIGGLCTYGVVQRGSSEPFLLGYCATSLLGCSIQDAPAACCTGCNQLPLQVIPIKGTGLRFQVLWQGKPLPDAEVVALVPGKDQPLESKSDAKGIIEVQAVAGLYGIRARQVEKKEGQHEGKEYREVRHYATLVVQVAKGSGSAAADRADVKEDPAASKLLKDARAARARWDKFPGFTADAVVNFNGKTSKGKVRIEASGKVTLDGIDADMEGWARRTLASVVGHRLDESASRDTPCTFLDDNTQHPLGRAIRVLNDELHSSYRIRDNQLMEVNRQTPEGRFTISVLENRPNAEGKYLSVAFIVNYWNLGSGDLQRSEAHHQTWTRVGRYDLPAATTVVASGREASRTAQSVTLSNHRLLEK